MLEPDRLHGAEPRRVVAAACEFLDRHAPFEELELLPVVRHVRTGGRERLEEVVVRLLREGQVEVIGRLAVASLAVRHVHVDGVAVDDGCGGVVEAEELHADARSNALGEHVAGERAGGEHHHAVGNVGHLLGVDGDERVLSQCAGHEVAEALAVDCNGAPCGDARRLRRRHHQAARCEHLGLQQPLGIGLGVPPEAVAAHEFGEAVRVVGGRHLDGAHLEEVDGDAVPSDGERGVGARHAGTDHAHARVGREGHGRSLAATPEHRGSRGRAVAA